MVEHLKLVNKLEKKVNVVHLRELLSGLSSILKVISESKLLPHELKGRGGVGDSVTSDVLLGEVLVIYLRLNPEEVLPKKLPTDGVLIVNSLVELETVLENLNKSLALGQSQDIGQIRKPVDLRKGADEEYNELHMRRNKNLLQSLINQHTNLVPYTEEVERMAFQLAKRLALEMLDKITERPISDLDIINYAQLSNISIQKHVIQDVIDVLNSEGYHDFTYTDHREEENVV